MNWYFYFLETQPFQSFLKEITFNFSTAYVDGIMDDLPFSCFQRLVKPTNMLRNMSEDTRCCFGLLLFFDIFLGCDFQMNEDSADFEEAYLYSSWIKMMFQTA